MSQSTAILGLPLIQASQAQKHVTHNEAICALDTLVQPVVLDRDRTEPPASPSEGDSHLVAAGATGAWSGHGLQLATFSNNGWVYYLPRPGWRIQVLAEAAQVIFDGTDWQHDAPATLGVNTAADTVNRLAVAGDATLLSHDGAGHQVKINKAGSGDTNSVLFQTGWSGRAEMGCAGDDAFSVKVSADGAAWAEALRFDPASGQVDVPSSHGTWTPTLGTNQSGDLVAATGITTAYAYWWKVGPLVTVHLGVDFVGVPSSDFSQKSTFALRGLPFAPRNDGGSIDQGAVSGFVYRSIGSALVSLVSGGVSSPDHLYGFIFHTGAGEARVSDRFHLRATYMADT